MSLSHQSISQEEKGHKGGGHKLGSHSQHHLPAEKASNQQSEKRRGEEKRGGVEEVGGSRGGWGERQRRKAEAEVGQSIIHSLHGGQHFISSKTVLSQPRLLLAVPQGAASSYNMNSFFISRLGLLGSITSGLPSSSAPLTCVSSSSSSCSRSEASLFEPPPPPRRSPRPAFRLLLPLDSCGPVDALQ